MARTRSRKRRPTGAQRAPASSKGEAAADPDGALGSTAQGASAKTRASAQSAPSTKARAASRSPTRGASRPPTRGTSRTAPTYGERPQAPWHPLPLSELLILVGAIGAAIGFAKASQGFSNGGPAVFAGIAAVAIGTVDVTLREHLSGYRSHTVMLALIPVLVFHSVVIFGLAAITSVPRLLNVGLFAIDIALFATLFKVLRARFLDARHARVLREG
ncbi:MAG TPA: hypothetical protein VNY52_03325 [Solirubrobacteraceae bacterium]|jgi:hypothetical protein|nr:hypothetical protein [Solirubrobacteraceae bacterium]